MSTILKALQKSKAHPQTIVIDKSLPNGWKLMMAAALLIITVLFALLLYLFFKPAEVLIIEAEQQLVDTTQQKATPSTTSAPVQPEVLLETALKETKSTAVTQGVSEITFKTKPLPQVEKKAAALNQQYSETNDHKEGVVLTSAHSDDLESSIALADVPSELQQRFALAVELEQAAQSPITKPSNNTQVVVESDISKMPAQFQYQVPVMSYDSHVYSTQAQDRWIRINGVDMRVGDYVGSVELVEIMPQYSVFRLGKQRFTLESLQDWKG